MTREETKMIIKMLSSVYVNEFSKLTEDKVIQMIDVWTMLLEDEDANKIATVTKAYLKSNSNAFMPTPAMLINMAYELFTPQGMTELEAWNIVYRAVCNSGYNAQREYDNLPQEIKALCSPKQLIEWSQMDISTLNSVVASNFMRSFKVREKQRSDYAKLPNETKNLISELNMNMKLENKGETK